jgi:hypothetical protein
LIGAHSSTATPCIQWQRRRNRVVWRYVAVLLLSSNDDHHSSQSIRMDPNYNLLIGTPDPLSAGGASWRRHDRIAIGNECRGYQASALSSAEGRNFPSSRKLGKVPDTSKSLVPRLASALQPYRPALHCPSHLVLNDFRVCLILVVSRALCSFWRPLSRVSKCALLPRLRPSALPRATARPRTFTFFHFPFPPHPTTSVSSRRLPADNG